jgi:tetratricopeptide (TPR) repeat protein
LALTPGTRLGVYQTTAQIGEGGMGQVYRATDTKLKRQVAIKILPPSLAADHDRLARFQREAEVLASLNHPNIATVYGFEDSGEIGALVMELVEGPTLADRITQGPIPLSEALPIAKQIAQALGAAHEQGIVHRDLKPANIKVRPDGTVKVLDFGLAKPTEASRAPGDLGNSPTITSPAMMTDLGMILGTAAYMSPEQARGKPVDKQTDIWAFGCVFYEMLVGRAAFAGETISDTIGKLLEREPDWQALSASTPVKIRDLLRRCLEKEQQRRLNDISDARIEIEDASTVQRTQGRAIKLSVAAAALVGVGLASAMLYFTRTAAPIKAHEPVILLIADFANNTGDTTFDHTVEPMLRFALEGAGFINAYDRSRVRTTFGVPPPERLDEAAARQLAMKHAIGVVLSGTIDRAGDAYEISVKLAQPISGNVAVSAKTVASTKDQVLSAVTKVAVTVRNALGEKTPEVDQLFAMRSISTGSLGAVSQYAAGIELQSRGKYDEAILKFQKAVEIEPNFGLAYNSLSVNLKNVGRIRESEMYAKEALRHLDGMTERERLATRGNFYRITGDLQQCITEYGELIARYSADTVAHNNRGLCLGRLRDFRGAMEEARQALKILPNHMTYRANLALFANYMGDFATAEKEIRSIPQPTAGALQALPLSLIGQGRLEEAGESYEKLSAMGAFGASFGAAGLGDLAVYEGRFSDAVKIFERAAAEAMKANNPDVAALKFAAIAHAQLSRGHSAAAIAAADEALANSNALSVRFLSARILVEAGASAKAQPIASSLASELATEPQAYGKIIEGDIALKKQEFQLAIKLLTEANAVVDTWIGHFDLGRAYIEGRAFAQADSEFDRCIKRRGEALLLVDEDPTYGYFPLTYYYLGRAREALQSVGYKEVCVEYLKIRGQSNEDPLLSMARRCAS